MNQLPKFCSTPNVKPPVPFAGISELLALLFRRRVHYRVVGESMLPTLHTGDIIIVDPNVQMSEGDVVVALHPYEIDRVLIKRIAVRRNDGYVLLGDQPNSSTDSRTLGLFKDHQLLGRVTSRFNINRH